MALSDLYGWNEEAQASSAVNGTACGAGDEPKPTACGTACGASDEPKPTACGTACGAGDK